MREDSEREREREREREMGKRGVGRRRMEEEGRRETKDKSRE